MRKQQKNGQGQQQLLEGAFQDLACRFLNCPDEAYESWERLFFQLEACHWHYDDFLREEDPRLPSLGWKEFTRQFFRACPLLQPHVDSVDEFLVKFSEYKSSVPVFGALMMDPSMKHCVLVRGWQKNSAWTCPKGKINEGEPELDCAIREVLEETGYDCSHLVNKEDFLTASFGSHRMKIYLAPGVPMDTYFETQTRKEIGDIQWFKISDIPKQKSSHYFLVAPLLKPLKAWIGGKRRGTPTKSQNRTPTKNQNRVSPPARAVRSEPSRPTRQRAGDSDPEDRRNDVTFAGDTRAWGAEEMFKVNQQRFGVTTDYSFDLYTTKIDPASAKKAESEANRLMGGRAPKSERAKPTKNARSRQPSPPNVDDRGNDVTFAGDTQSWSAAEMFKVNQERFGVTTNYSYDLYTTKLAPTAQVEAAAEKLLGASSAPQDKPQQQPRKRQHKEQAPPQPVTILRRDAVPARPAVVAPTNCAAQAANSSWGGFQFNTVDIMSEIA